MFNTEFMQIKSIRNKLGNKQLSLEKAKPIGKQSANK